MRAIDRYHAATTQARAISQSLPRREAYVSASHEDLLEAYRATRAIGRMLLDAIDAATTDADTPILLLLCEAYEIAVGELGHAWEWGTAAPQQRG